MKVAHRNQFLALAKTEAVAAQLYYVDAPYETRLQRVLNRNKEKGTTFSFEVSPEMFAYMEKEFEKPTEAELQSAIVVDTSV